MADATGPLPRPALPRLPLRLGLLVLVLLGSCLAFMTVGAVGDWGFLLTFRGTRLAALMLVGTCLSVATILFQTITANRILTPSALGFDSLYVLLLTGLVFSLGGTGYAQIPSPVLFAANLVAMTALGFVLFGLLMAAGRGDIHRMVLAGIVLGILVRSVSGFLQRMIDPTSYSQVQAASFARFTFIEPGLLAMTALVTLPALALAWRLRHRLDALSLGAGAATGLGVPPLRLRRQALVLICVLVAAATALAGPFGGGIGPAGFFGLIASALAHRLTPDWRHAVLLPSAGLIGCIVLVAGQTVMERVLHLATPLPVVIEALGGGLFLVLLFTGRTR